MARHLKIASAQLGPLHKADSRASAVARLIELLRESRAMGAKFVVFPELGLTGYLLQDLAGEVAMRLDDPRLASLAATTGDAAAIEADWGVRPDQVIDFQSLVGDSKDGVKGVAGVGPNPMLSR